MKILIPIILILILGQNLFAVSENTKIQLLLTAIEKSKLTFIRNGKEYTSLAAREHIEMKLKRSWTTIDTAKKFIKHIATKSSISGNHYMLKLSDGTRIKTADWLYSELKAIEKNETKK